jgi:hypothetical protein
MVENSLAPPWPTTEAECKVAKQEILEARLEPDLPEPSYKIYPRGYFDAPMPPHRPSPRLLVPLLDPDRALSARNRHDWDLRLWENVQNAHLTERALKAKVRAKEERARFKREREDALRKRYGAEP